MDFQAKKKFITEELAKRIRVAVEIDGYHGNDPEGAFDAYAATGLLESFDSFEAAVNRAAQEGGDRAAVTKPTRDQLIEVRKDIERFANVLAESAEVSKVDLVKVSPKVFDRRAKQFEGKFKSKLRIISADCWTGI